MNFFCHEMEKIVHYLQFINIRQSTVYRAVIPGMVMRQYGICPLQKQHSLRTTFSTDKKQTPIKQSSLTSSIRAT